MEKLTVCELEKMTHLEIVDLPIQDGDFPWFFVNVYQSVDGSMGISGSELMEVRKRTICKRPYLVGIFPEIQA